MKAISPGSNTCLYRPMDLIQEATQIGQYLARPTWAAGQVRADTPLDRAIIQFPVALQRAETLYSRYIFFGYQSAVIRGKNAGHPDGNDPANGTAQYTAFFGQGGMAGFYLDGWGSTFTTVGAQAGDHMQMWSGYFVMIEREIYEVNPPNVVQPYEWLS